MKRRNTSAAAFSTALQFTPHLPALMHAHAAYATAVLGASHAEDPIRPGTHHAVAKLVDEFVRLLGTDLTIVDPANPFHRTGPTRLDQGDYRTHRPWEWPDKVAMARAFGKDRASLETVSESGRSDSLRAASPSDKTSTDG